MKLGLHLSNFTYGVDNRGFPAKLDEIVTGADQAGFDRISVMDHYFQIPNVGPAQNEMFEAYGILGYIAARTSRVKLGTLVTGVTYRHPGFLAKQVTGLDVLSGGRAWLGIGAAWFQREHEGLGIPFPPLKERFERLEEAINICLQMWSDNDGAFEGKHYQLRETLCSPKPVQSPRPPIMVGGSGEKKTLRLVARYADICNVRGSSPEETARLFGILREHCEREGRDFNAITKTIVGRFDPGPNGERASEEIDRLAAFAEIGAQGALGYLIGCENPAVMEQMATKVIPALEKV